MTHLFIARVNFTHPKQIESYLSLELDDFF